eukprot:922546_1
MDLFSFDEDLHTSRSFQGWHLSVDEPSTSSSDALSRPSPTDILLRSPPPTAKTRGFSRVCATVFEDSTPSTSKSTSIACCPGSIRAGQLNHASATVTPPDGSSHSHDCQRPPTVVTRYKDLPNGGVLSPPSVDSATKSIPQSLSEDIGSPTICANLACMENVHLRELTFDIFVSDRYGGQATICELFLWNSVKDVKDTLQMRGYPSASMQRLFVHGDKVKNIRTLHDCDISHGSDLYIMSIRNLTAQQNGFTNFYGDATAAPAECLDLVRNVSHDTASGYAPALAFDDTGGTYFLKGRHKVKCAVFKPEDEEQFAPNNDFIMSSKHMNPKKAPLFDCCIRVLLRILEIDVESVSMEIGSLTNFADWLISMCTSEVDGQKLAGRLEVLSSLILYADPREVLINDQQNAVEILLAFLSNDLHRVTEASVQCLVFLHAFPDTSIITRVSDHDAQSEFAEGILSIINEADGKYHPELLSKFLTIVEDIFN